MPTRNKLALKWVIVSIITLFGVSIHKEPITTNTCSNNPIFCQIVKNKPNIDRNYAMKLSNVIYYTAKLYDINPKRYAAILAQESGYKLNAINKVSMDYGMAQINFRTIAALGFDKNRLLTDIEYSIEAGAIVLSKIKKSHGNKEKDFWTRYNSSNVSKRELYAKLVSRYM